MDDPGRPRLLPRDVRRSLIALAAVLVASVVLGGATSYGQTYLPDAINSLANSPSGWTAVTVVLVWTTRETSVLTSALGGVVGFAGLNLGYQLVSTARGFFYTGEFWFVVALIVGPFVGVAAAWLHRRDVLAAIGAGLVTAIGLADGSIGLLLLTHTSPVYWILVIAASVLLLVAVSTWRLRASRARWVAALVAVGLSGCAVTGMLVIA